MEQAVSMLQLLAAEHGEHAVNPFATGIGAFALLLLALWITTRLNRDR
ncbi:hypothetical protein [Carbonactinospora thermoautotrophica]|uniref:Putative membrane protein n=1 Tax=Carbonactinospora thermoautotrophica TaxID=1469144 RepID=A0A132MW90_9ACTN|nr:hypothetical protein [Carbonactinospora thermoautotrophica]KWX02006.1 putative membrane protein [Carbonactinospora thermoautotrophica]